MESGFNFPKENQSNEGMFHFDVNHLKHLVLNHSVYKKRFLYLERWCRFSNIPRPRLLVFYIFVLVGENSFKYAFVKAVFRNPCLSTYSYFYQCIAYVLLREQICSFTMSFSKGYQRGKSNSLVINESNMTMPVSYVLPYS